MSIFWNNFHLSFSILRYPGHALTHDCTHLHLSGLEAHLFIPALASVTEGQAHAIKQTYVWKRGVLLLIYNIHLTRFQPLAGERWPCSWPLCGSIRYSNFIITQSMRVMSETLMLSGVWEHSVRSELWMIVLHIWPLSLIILRLNYFTICEIRKLS